MLYIFRTNDGRPQVYNKTFVVEAADANIAEAILKASGVEDKLKRMGCGSVVTVSTGYSDHYVEVSHAK